MKIILKYQFYLLIMIVFFSCKKQKNKIVLKSIENKIVNDTIIKSSDVIIVVPNKYEIKKLKEKHGQDNFDIMVDDANSYMATIIQNLKDKNIVYSSKSNYSVGENSIKMSKDDFNSPWFVIDNTSEEPLKYSLVDYHLKFNKSAKDLSFFENNTNYFIVDIDLNNDGLLDKVVSSKPYKGDSLYFFCNKGDSYQCTLESVNFSGDGGFIIKNLSSIDIENEILKIYLYFPDGGNYQATHYISYLEDDNWVLKKTIYETTTMEQNNVTYLCEVIQNINMNDFNSKLGFEKFKYIPNESDRNKFCSIKEKAER